LPRSGAARAARPVPTLPAQRPATGINAGWKGKAVETQLMFNSRHIETFPIASFGPIRGHAKRRQRGAFAFPGLGMTGAFAFVAILTVAAPARAEQPARVEHAGWASNQCVSCHQSEMLPLSLGHSMPEWRASAHARGGVGCEKCHGGDSTKSDATAAHAGVLPSSDASSKVSPHNLAATCGSCHQKEYEAYKGTVHAKEVRDNGDAATCGTCHGAMATSLPSPTEINSRCTLCHDRPVQARAALSWLAGAKIQLLRTRRTLEAAKTAAPEWYADAKTRFHDMEKGYAELALKWHTFEMESTQQHSRDLLKLGKLLDEEAHLKMKMSKSKDH